MTRDGLEELHESQERDNPCSDSNDRGYWRRRLRELESGKKNENSTDN
tara:strand:+ start:426 stop:569 length:144 start_codon:yes stop_codon:yes gene_type:complete